MKDNIVIGVLGGMGTYATIHVFQQYAELFKAEKEWERPRIIIDNRCTMPSRVRAYMLNEKVEQLIDEMTESLQSLIGAGCNRIILACNTSHLFLPMIYDRIPILKNYVINIIDACAERLKQAGVDRAFLLGTEGTIDSKIYQKALQVNGIKCNAPVQEEYYKLRECIEAVKRNKYTDETRNLFLKLINRYDTCILGCTELPILYERYKDGIECKNVYDPLLIALETIYNEFVNQQ